MIFIFGTFTFLTKPHGSSVKICFLRGSASVVHSKYNFSSASPLVISPLQ